MDTTALQSLMSTGIEMVVTYAPKLLLAIITLFVGFKIAAFFQKMAGKAFTKAKVDISLASFMTSIIGILFKVLVLLTVAGMVGIEVTSFIALLGAMGLAVGLSLQGALANFAGGVLILLFKPFKVGDRIEAQGVLGDVKEISIVATVLNSLDNKQLIVPNGPLASGNITNFTAEKMRRVDLTFGIGYNDDIKKAREVILNIAKECKMILKNPDAFVGVMTLNDSSVDLECRVWCKTADYWDVYFFMNERVKEAFDANQITIPYPHQEVFMHNA